MSEDLSDLYAMMAELKAMRSKFNRPANDESFEEEFRPDSSVWEETRLFFAISGPDIKSRGALNRKRRIAEGRSDQTIKKRRMIRYCARGICVYCGTISATIHLDHFIPLFLGGHDVTENIVPACARCNLKKSRYHPSVFMKKWSRVQIMAMVRRYDEFEKRKRDRDIVIAATDHIKYLLSLDAEPTVPDDRADTQGINSDTHCPTAA